MVFWLAHVYAYVLGEDMAQEYMVTRAEVVHALHENWSLIEAVINDTAASVAAFVIATVELAAAGAYATARHGASPRGVVAAAAGGMGLGLLVAVLKTLAFLH